MKQIKPQSGYVQTGPLKMYYDVQGSGANLLLLYGGLCTTDTVSELRQLLNAKWTTIGVEQQAHGHTADVDRPLRFEQMADDTAAVLRHLDVSACHAFGWSDGGNVALGLAIRHPKLIDRLAICGTNGDNEGLDPKMLKQMQDGLSSDPQKAAASMPTMLREAYEQVAPRPQDWPVLVQRVFEQAVSFKGWTDDQLKAVKSPVLVMIGDQDIVPVAHANKLYKLFSQSELAVLPRTDHMASVSRVEWVAIMLGEFLTANLSAPLPMSAN